MNELLVSTLVVAAILGAAWIGGSLRSVLPQDHLTDDTKDMVKIGIGFLATLAAMVLGLLIASAKSSYDTKVAEIEQLSAKVILLDRNLRDFGADVDPVRARVRSVLTDQMLPRWELGTLDLASPAQTAASPGPAALHEVISALRVLTPTSDVQRLARDRAIGLCEDLMQTRVLLVEQSGRTIPMPFLVVLVFWLAAITASLTLFAPRNGILVVIVIVCAMSFGSAIFLVLEMDQPYTGVIRISDAPVRTALKFLSQ